MAWSVIYDCVLPGHITLYHNNKNPSQHFPNYVHGPVLPKLSFKRTRFSLKMISQVVNISVKKESSNDGTAGGQLCDNFYIGIYLTTCT